MRVIDSHCHLELADFGPDDEARRVVMERARAAGVAHFVVVGAGGTLANVENAVMLARAHDDVSAAVGIHPHDARGLDDAMLDRIAALAETEPRVVAVGETGLDYYYDHSTPAEQQAAYRRFIAVARRARKPLVLHIRDAHADALRIFVEESGRDAGAIVHCFTGDREEARRWLDLGCYISFSGIVTFKSAEELRRAAELVPADRLLVETDCPYLAPVPHRGRKNEPAFVVETLKAIAKVRRVGVDELAAQTVAATVAAFGLPSIA